MGTKMSDEALDQLFEKMDRNTARMIANQHTPTKRTTKKPTSKKADTKRRNDEMKDEIRLNHAIMEYDHEIKYCKKVLANGAVGDTQKDAKSRLKEAEKNKKKLLEKNQNDKS